MWSVQNWWKTQGEECNGYNMVIHGYNMAMHGYNMAMHGYNMVIHGDNMAMHGHLQYEYYEYLKHTTGIHGLLQNVQWLCYI